MGRAAAADPAVLGIAVVGVAVPAHPAEGRAGVVLARLGPLGQAGDLAPAAARARVEVHRQAERVLAEPLVTGGREPVPDLHVVAADQVEHVGQDAPVHARPGLARDRHEAPAARDRAQAPDAAGRAVVDPLAGEVELVEHLGSHGVPARPARRGVRHEVAQDDRVVAPAAVRGVAPGAAVEPIVALTSGERVEARAAAEDVGAAGRGEGVVALVALERGDCGGHGKRVVALAAAHVGGQRRREREGVVAVAEVGLDAGGAGADRADALGHAAGARRERSAGVGHRERRGARRDRDRVVLAGGGRDAQRSGAHLRRGRVRGRGQQQRREERGG